MTGFDKLFWGFLFLFINFRIGGIDILPNFVGYLFFYFGLKDLQDRDYYFLDGKKYAIILGVLSIFTLYDPATNASGYSFSPVGIIGIIMLVLDLILVYHVTSGINNLAINLEEFELADKAKKRWKLYLFSNLGAFLLLIFIFVPTLLIILLLALVVLILVTIVLLLMLMKESNRLLYNSIDD